MHEHVASAFHFKCDAAAGAAREGRACARADGDEIGDGVRVVEVEELVLSWLRWWVLLLMMIVWFVLVMLSWCVMFRLLDDAIMITFCVAITIDIAITITITMNITITALSHAVGSSN